MKLLKPLSICHLHVHQSPDPGKVPSPAPLFEEYTITTSSWFDSHDDYLNAIRGSDIYIAPRFSEGIGMGFLEAMNYGCCVIAHDMATHNEYISNWKNGILVNFHSPDDMVISADASIIRAIGLRARNDAKKWRDNWVKFYSQIAMSAIEAYIENAELGRPKMASMSTIHLDLNAIEELKKLSAAHRDWSTYWLHLSKLSSTNTDRSQIHGMIMPRVNMLIKQGNLVEAYGIITEILLRYPREATIYHLFSEQLLSRINRSTSTV